MKKHLDIINMKNLHNSRILITGANGFIGKHLCKGLLDNSCIIGTLDLSNADYIGSVCDSKFLEDVFSDFSPEYVFHLAAIKDRTTTINSFYDAINVNLLGTLNLLRIVEKIEKLKKILILGTVEEYGVSLPPFSEGQQEKPVTSYSFSKLCMTKLSELVSVLYDLPIIVIRPTLAYGPGQGEEMFIPSLINALLRGERFKMTKGEQTRDFIYIDDLVSALLLCAESEKINKGIFNIGSGEIVKLKDLALKVQNVLELKGLIEFGAVDYRKLEIMDYSIDNSKAKKILNWKTNYTLDIGLEKTIEYYKNERSREIK